MCVYSTYYIYTHTESVCLEYTHMYSHSIY